MNYCDALIDTICSKMPFQRQYLIKSADKKSLQEIDGFNQLLQFHISRGYSINELVKAYIVFFKDVMKERAYFKRNNAYRFHSLKEVSENIYSNNAYMTMYMLGLSISSYLWQESFQIYEWFLSKIRNRTGDKYLEIGTGYGRNFLSAVQNSGYRLYTALDISEASIRLTQKYVDFTAQGKGKNIDYLHTDFLNYVFNCRFDAIVAGEVLEHVEAPVSFLNKIAAVSKPDTFIYLSTAVNSPAIDHIYLFKSISEVFEMVESCNFKIEDCFSVGTQENGGGKESYDIAMVLSCGK